MPQSHAGAMGIEEEQPENTFKVSWTENDPDHPQSMSRLRRWFIVFLVSNGSLCVQIDPEFGCSQIVAILGLSFFVWGLALGPLIFAPLSEIFGRRPIYLVSLTTFLIWLVPCAVAKNIQTMIIARFFNALAGSAFLSVAGGTVSDMFPRSEISKPMMLYTCSPFMGPELGPLIGGFINQFTSWYRNPSLDGNLMISTCGRWTFHVLLIWAAVLLVLHICFVPETFHAIILERKAKQIRTERGDDRWQSIMKKGNQPIGSLILRSIYRPLTMLALEPMCLNLCVFSAILLGIIYLFFGAFQLVFTNIYGMNLWQHGLCFLGMLIAMPIAALTDPIWRSLYARLASQARSKDADARPQPEWRLPPAIVGAPTTTVGLFIFAWTIYPDVHWIAPIIGSGVFGFGTVLSYSGIFTFLVDAYPDYAASALAANSFARCLLGGAFPLFGNQMYERLGYHWATSLLGFLTLIMAPFPYIFFRYGQRIRKVSRFATA
ncbi:putative drug/proton antiporter YHK8 [Penicillium rolfsii]|nr:putative drug/proton antiporter YHK8 [Penicillium rolfsii]